MFFFGAAPQEEEDVPDHFPTHVPSKPPQEIMEDNGGEALNEDATDDDEDDKKKGTDEILEVLNFTTKPAGGVKVFHTPAIDPARLPQVPGVRIQLNVTQHRWQAWYPGAKPASHSCTFDGVDQRSSA